MSATLHVLLEAKSYLEGDVEYGKVYVFIPSTWPCIYFAVFWRDWMLHGPSTCLYRMDFTEWTFLKSSFHICCTVLENRAGLGVACDLVPQEAASSPKGFSTVLAGV